MEYAVIDLAQTPLTRARAVEAYNAGITLLGKIEDDFVKSFKDTTTATARVLGMRDSLTQMHGYAALEQAEDGSIRWTTDKPQGSATTKSENPASSESDTAAKKPRVGATTLNLAAPLAMLKEGNPKRANTRSHAIHELYAGCETGEDFVAKVVEAGHDRKLALGTLQWDIKHGIVSLG